MATTNYGTNRYGVNEGDVIMRPRGWKGDGTKRAVIYVHGAGELAISTILGSTAVPSKVNEAALLAAIADVYPVVAVDAGVFGAGGPTDSNCWGNSNGQTRIGQAITYAQKAVGSGGWANPLGLGAKPGPAALLGLSMGHVLSLNFAAANPALVTCIIGILPVNDLDDIRDNDRPVPSGASSLGYQEGIGTAWATGTQRVDASCTTTSGTNSVTDAAILTADQGRYVSGPGIPLNTFVGTVTNGVSFLLSSSPTSQVSVNATASGTVALNITNRWTAAGTPALPAGANPAKPVNQTNLIPIQQKNWAANDDTICTIATANALTANLGPNCQLVNMGNTGGHSDASVGAVPVADVLAYLAKFNN